MPAIKLSKLPDRMPVKITFMASADLNQALQDYAAAYQASYGTTESVAELVPFILAAFIESDVAFKKALHQAKTFS
jgi:hypothetical protein